MRLDEKYSVTVICLTYNHNDYIDQCLSSLTSQVTSFKYRIIVHDDASTDGTREKVIQWAHQFPDKILPVCQDRNIFSQGKSYLQYISQYIEGEYISFCEGDDWWTSNDKLQKQFNYMQACPDAAGCTHDSILFDDSLQSVVGYCPAHGIERDLRFSDLAKKGGWYISSNSLFMRKEYFNLPDEYSNWGVGDYPRVLYLARYGRIHFFPQPMSAYRVCAKGSWSRRTSENPEAKIEANKKIIQGLHNVMNFYTQKERECLEEACRSLERQNIVLEHNIRRLVEEWRSCEFSCLPVMQQFKWTLRCILPNTVFCKIQHIRQHFKANKYRNIKV